MKGSMPNQVTRNNHYVPEWQPSRRSASARNTGNALQLGHNLTTVQRHADLHPRPVAPQLVRGWPRRCRLHESRSGRSFKSRRFRGRSTSGMAQRGKRLRGRCQDGHPFRRHHGQTRAPSRTAAGGLQPSRRLVLQRKEKDRRMPSSVPSPCRWSSTTFGQPGSDQRRHSFVGTSLSMRIPVHFRIRESN
jgi:hypothetical protein